MIVYSIHMYALIYVIKSMHGFELCQLYPWNLTDPLICFCYLCFSGPVLIPVFPEPRDLFFCYYFVWTCSRHDFYYFIDVMLAYRCYAYCHTEDWTFYCLFHREFYANHIHSAWHVVGTCWQATRTSRFFKRSC